MTRNVTELTPLLKRLQLGANGRTRCPSASPWPAGSNSTTPHS